MVTLKYIHCLFHVGASCLLAPQLIYSSQERSGGSCVHLTMPKVQAVLERGGLIQSRWRLVISEYNSVRAELLNSPVLEETNLMLYLINETTLGKWFKNKLRHDDITLLMSEAYDQ